MTQDHHFFTPERVDEQIEQFSRRLPGEAEHLPQSEAFARVETRRFGEALAGAESQSEQDASTRLVRELQAYYQGEYQQNRAFLAQARRRIAAHRFSRYEGAQERTPVPAPVLKFSQGRIRMNQHTRAIDHPAGRKLARPLSLLAAVLVAGLLVGTLAMVLTLSHAQQTSQGGSGKKATATSVPTATPTSIPAGKVVHTQHAPAGMNFTPPLAWSPDGKHIATVAINLQTEKTQLRIWDATTGGNLLTASLTVNMYNVQWSPTGKYVELDNGQVIMIANSQTGTIVKTINYQNQAAFNVPGAGPSALASYVPLSSGYGIYAITWAPDGLSLAATISSPGSSKVVLLNSLTGAVNATIDQQSSIMADVLAFSSDGKYLAGSYTNESKVVVWNVATRQVVTQVAQGHQAFKLAWQPGTHHLAAGLLFPASVQLWDVDSQKLLKTYVGHAALAWSPDGKELALYKDLKDQFSGSHVKDNTVTIVNASTGAQVGLYTSQNKNTTVYAVYWSPDGRYLASSEMKADTNLVVVWTA